MNKLEYNANFQSDMDEAALRLELERELKNKKQCSYQAYECTQLCLENYKYCSKHILQDKSAPYKQCSFIFSSNGKRCNLPAPRSDKKDYGYCSEHALKATLARNRQSAKHPLPCTAEVLLHSLSHYIKKPRIRSSSSSTQHSDDDRISPDSELKSAKFLDPFVDFDANSLYNDKCNSILDVCSESESDIEASKFSSVWQDAQADSSDDESIDSDNEDVLKHANVYTAEEVTLLTKDKLIRLQTLYIEQYRHLQYLLTKKRRKYLHSLKREKETCCNIYNQVRDNPKEQRLYKKLKALNNYQRCHGEDAILNKRLQDLRVKASDGTSKTQIFSKCVFTEGGVKCGERSLPLAKHCQKHILEDPNQVLFHACGKMTGDVECPTPVAAIFDDSTCSLHLEIPFLRSYNHVRKDSESDADEMADSHMNFHQPPPQLTDNIKTEFINYDIPPEIPKMESLPTMLFEETTQNVPERCSGSSLFNINFENIMEKSKQSKEGMNKVSEVSQPVVENDVVLDAEVKSEKMEINEDSLEVTKDDIDVSGNLDHDIDVSGNVDHDIDISDNVDHNIDISDNVDHNIDVSDNVDHNIDVSDNVDHNITEEVVIEDTKVVEEIDNKNNSEMNENEFHWNMTENSTSNIQDTAVDTLLKAAEMISDQDNRIKAGESSVNQEESMQIEESVITTDPLPVQELDVKKECSEKLDDSNM